MTGERNEEALLIELVLIFQQSAWQGLGKVTNPETGKTEVHLAQARHAIDMLAMLERKTTGNVTEGEQKFLANALTQLRLNYVDCAREAGAAHTSAADRKPAPGATAPNPEKPASPE
jgi:hypothetical protein